MSIFIEHRHLVQPLGVEQDLAGVEVDARDDGLQRRNQHLAQRAAEHIDVVAARLQHVLQRAEVAPVGRAAAQADQVADERGILVEFHGMRAIDVDHLAAQPLGGGSVADAVDIQENRVGRDAVDGQPDGLKGVAALEVGGLQPFKPAEVAGDRPQLHLAPDSLRADDFADGQMRGSHGCIPPDVSAVGGILYISKKPRELIVSEALTW